MGKARKQGGREAKKKGVGSTKEAIVLIPLTYNDGSNVPRHVLDAIRE